ncbi:N-succinylarginine dihydrolase [Acinetobacter rathckeae]|uniref:N-succinylarginine dihydrolase n=1 Tax=Acinetobacter rathckeae TaxID=2605272 RepID=UPI0018A2B035|nr:N-succinylarginine dihydrolase [Acinetobacter rathckeae]MBF7689013.1 N-succinylarginine dihydrolase [Acinetobacter rathckeae]MBF7696533.1 N-succinylarginine dihydrolase [Acinetobacter rathckeae]
MSGYEINFDGLVGPTHHYAGLSFGNEASTKNKKNTSNPKLAALQGLEKMKTLADMGLKQAVFAPQERPHLTTLRQLGFSGTDEQVITQAMKTSPDLLSSLSSASSMWTANSCTVTPSADSADGKIHFTPANLNNKFHRAIEHPTTGRILQAMFHDEQYFSHHHALPSVALFGDEGAANHNRLGGAYDKPSLNVFVYGQQFIGNHLGPKKYPARQSLEASQAIARLHGLSDLNTVFLQQNPDVIDQGVFHNDVIAVSNQQVLFCHEYAFVQTAHAFAEIEAKMAALGATFNPIIVPNSRVSVQDAVSTYLFNSQILTRTDGKMTLVVPEESRQNQAVWDYLTEMTQSGLAIDQIKVFDLRESMRNGGGPACLRLRVAVNEDELEAINQHVFMNEAVYEILTDWVEKHYRDELSQHDLADPALLQENRTALDELTQILKLGSVYDFQRI